MRLDILLHELNSTFQRKTEAMAAASVVISETCVTGKARLFAKEPSAKTVATTFSTFFQIKARRPHTG